MLTTRARTNLLLATVVALTWLTPGAAHASKIKDCRQIATRYGFPQESSSGTECGVRAYRVKILDPAFVECMDHLSKRGDRGLPGKRAKACMDPEVRPAVLSGDFGRCIQSVGGETEEGIYFCIASARQKFAITPEMMSCMKERESNSATTGCLPGGRDLGWYIDKKNAAEELAKLKGTNEFKKCVAAYAGFAPKVAERSCLIPENLSAFQNDEIGGCVERSIRKAPKRWVEYFELYGHGDFLNRACADPEFRRLSQIQGVLDCLYRRGSYPSDCTKPDWVAHAQSPALESCVKAVQEAGVENVVDGGSWDLCFNPEKAKVTALPRWKDCAKVVRRVDADWLNYGYCSSDKWIEFSLTKGAPACLAGRRSLQDRFWDADRHYDREDDPAAACKDSAVQKLSLSPVFPACLSAHFDRGGTSIGRIIADCGHENAEFACAESLIAICREPAEAYRECQSASFRSEVNLHSAEFATILKVMNGGIGKFCGGDLPQTAAERGVQRPEEAADKSGDRPEKKSSGGK